MHLKLDFLLHMLLSCTWCKQHSFGAHTSTDDLALQVTDKDADGVLDEIESAIFQAAASILAGQGFSYRYTNEHGFELQDTACNMVETGSAA